MDYQNATATSVISEFESGFSKILPDLAKLLQRYNVSTSITLEIEVESPFSSATFGCTCCFVNGVMKCGTGYRISLPEGGVGLDVEKAEQLCKDVQSELSKVLRNLSEAAKQTNGTFKLQIFINPAPTAPRKPIVCQWVSQNDRNTLECSNS
ncbi:hypothetical protein [Calothrix sp. PCC 6303]|uniref:hypothetical protein n=1 Tax=Calothrix sp. PCC 6303 TaxID=1170562 RepID=UPI0002A037C4|nr:hypothetical protein [Calothrix sp. PCC 6303]AFZ01065.1 hypothetical protein Cal6303_2037 [Calothrix sp. PCC 6303]